MSQSPNPVTVAPLLALAARLLTAGRPADAIAPLRDAARLEPFNPIVQHDLGLACLEVGRITDAIAALQRAIASNPHYTDAYFRLGIALEKMGNIGEAIVAYDRATMLRPSLAEAWFRAGALVYTLGLRDEAIGCFRRAAVSGGNTSFGRLGKARALLTEDRNQEAEQVLRRTLALDPKNAMARDLLGNLLAEFGRFDEAREWFQRAVAIAPLLAGSYYELVRCRPVTSDDDGLLQRMEAALATPGLEAAQRLRIHLAIGKAAEDLGDYALAMEHFDAADAVRRGFAPFDPAAFSIEIDRLITRFTPELIAQAPELGSCDATPVLIVGMPRSGTTLVEQIVSIHPEAGAGGELHFWNQRGAAWHSSGAPGIDVSFLAQTAADYLGVLRAIAPKVARVTDKMPFNFLWAGLIHMAFPRATILHCRRTAADTALSIHQTHFNPSLTFPTGGAELVAYFRGYQRLVDHWRCVLPADRFIGVDATNIVNQTQRQWVRLAIPLDAIQEFRVDSLMATSEGGATGGAQLDVSSPSGTNRFHGRLFEYLRNDIFDAPLPTWASNGEAQQPLRLNQFGGSMGGPIVRDKTFFFLAGEAYRQNWGYPVSGDVPSQSFKATVPSTSPGYAIMNGFPGAGPKRILTPWTQATDPGDPYYMNYDLLTCECAQVVNESSVMLRLDQHLSEKTTGFMRLSYDRSVDTQPLSASATDLQQKVSAPVNGALEVLHVFNPGLVNEGEFGFNRSTDNQYNYSDSGIIYQIAVAEGPGPGFVTENYNYDSIYVGNSFSGIDNLTWFHDRHTFKAGVEIRHIQLNQNYGQHGKLTFSTLENLANNAVSKASLTGALPVNDLRKNDSFVYAQDEYKWRPNLVLNLGLRYSIFGLFDEAHGKANPFDFDTCGAQGFCGVGASFGQQNYGDIDPRVGVAWIPWKSGQTVVRGGFGMYHEDGQLDDQNLPAKNEVPSYSVTGSSKSPVSYPTVFGAGTLSPNAEQRDRKDSYVEQWSFSAQRELPANFVGTVSYLGSHGVHLLETNVVNLIDPATRLVQYPAFAPAIGWRGSAGMSSYNGLSVALRRSFSRGLLVTANYMWSHEIDNGSNGSGDGDEISPQNPLCLACDRASGAWDARHVVNGNAVYQLPFGLGKSMLNQRGMANTIAGGWELTTSALARTGFPVNVLMPSSYTAPDGASGTERPDLVKGVPVTPPGGRTLAEWINPAAFATPAGEFGTAPRDLIRGPGTWQIDLGASKTFPLPERGRLEFRSEFYNIFNHPQLGQPQSTFNPSNTTGFGSIINTVNTAVSPVTPVGSGTPREMQFALRFEF